ncbi:MAG: beta-galactosidase trimerization domain-containing protein [Lentisphaeria bacterium]|nr:beta-galactosidase trimerization domain-containing protein [Lentisphaeria bacterium]
MKKSLISALIISVLSLAAADNWPYNLRMISIPHPASAKKYNDANFRKELDSFKKSGVNTIMAHGSLQFLPGLPTGKSQWKKQVDYSTALPYSKAVKDANLKLFHHTTSTFAPIEALQNEKYKDWVSLNVNTGKVALRPPKTAYADACFMDMNHPAFRQLIFSRMAEYTAKCQVDGFMTDEVEWLPDIYASGSKDGSHKLYQERYNTPMPKGKVDMDDPAWRRYIDFRYASGGEFYQAEYAALSKVNPAIKLTGCLASISKYHRRIWAMGSASWLKGWNMGFFEMEEGFHPKGKRCGFLGSSYYPTYYREMALYNAFAEVYNWYGNFALGYPSTWKVADSEQFFLWAMCSSLSFRYWMRIYQAEPQWYAWEAQYEKDLIKPRRIANIGIFYPEKERDFRNDPMTAYRNWSGLSEALAAENVIADQIVELHFNKADLLKRFDLIILPKESFVGSKMTEELYKFVENGGTLLAVGISDTQDPFSKTGKQNELLKLFGIKEYDTTPNGSSAAAQINKLLPGEKGKVVLVANKPGFTKVVPREGATVIAKAPKAENIPAVILNKYGKGKCVLIPANWGDRFYSLPYQKKDKFIQTADFSQRKVFAKLVKSLLKNGEIVSVENLPEKYLFNAFDTAGHGDRVCRTIHILDCFDGYNKGETIAMTNRPCRFKALKERNGGKPLKITVNNFPALQEVRLLSPDNKKVELLKFQPGQTAGQWMITVPAESVKRYTIIVCDPGKK